MTVRDRPRRFPRTSCSLRGAFQHLAPIVQALPDWLIVPL